MQNILLANIGNRNLLIDNNNINKKSENFYEKTKYIFENIDDYKNKLDINIIDKILFKYKNIDTIYLFATNQNKPYNTDTYYSAKIIEFLLTKEKYKVYVLGMKNSPRIRENSFKFFEDFFQNNPKILNNNIIISGSGGAPTMKESLHFLSILKCSNSIIVDVDENNDENPIIKSKVENEYLKNIDKETLISMIESFDYSGALKFLYRSHIKTFELEQLIKYGLYRFNFNFEQLNKVYNISKTHKKLNILEDFGNHEDFHSLEDSIQNDYLMISELINNIEITFIKGEFAMLLGKVFRLYEALNRYFFEKNFNISTNLKDGKFNDFNDFILNNNDIRLFCENYTEKFAGIVLNGLDYGSPNNKILSTINKNFIKNDLLFIEWEKIEPSIKNLTDDRNNSIMAHGWRGSKREDIKKILNRIISFGNIFSDSKGNFYTELNKVIINIL